MVYIKVPNSLWRDSIQHAYYGVTQKIVAWRGILAIRRRNVGAILSFFQHHLGLDFSSPYTMQYRKMGSWHKTRLLRVSSRRLLVVAVKPVTDDGGMARHKQRTQIVSLYYRTMLKLRLIFIEFRNRFVITQKFLDIEQFNHSAEINIIDQCWANYWDIWNVQYLTVHIEVNSAECHWAVVHQYLIILFFFSFMNHSKPYIYSDAAW